MGKEHSSVGKKTIKGHHHHHHYHSQKASSSSNVSAAVHIQFKYKLTDNLEGLWSTVLYGKSLYVHIPTSTNGEGSKDSFVRLLEFAEEHLRCTNVVVFFQQERPDAASWMRALRFCGFTLLPPKHALRPDNVGFHYMNYVID